MAVRPSVTGFGGVHHHRSETHHAVVFQAKYEPCSLYLRRATRAGPTSDIADSRQSTTSAVRTPLLDALLLDFIPVNIIVLELNLSWSATLTSKRAALHHQLQSKRKHSEYICGHWFLLSPSARRSAGCLYTNATAQTFAGHTMRFTDTKSETLNLRVSPTFKQVLKEAADHEQRSMVNMLEVLLGDYCDRKGIVPPGQNSGHKRTRADRRPHVGAPA